MRAGIYKHYKGGYYQVLGIAAHSETNELMVVYISLNATLPGPRMRVRPLQGNDGFTTCVYTAGEGMKERFVYVGTEISKLEPQQ